ncbi:PREDICTED: LOC18786838 isoform, partial [Prunus dulcis]
DLFSSSCSCRFDPDLPTNPTAIGGDGDRSKCTSCSKAPDDDDKEDCSELNHPDDTTTRTECAACSKGDSELCSQVLTLRQGLQPCSGDSPTPTAGL